MIATSIGTLVMLYCVAKGQEPLMLEIHDLQKSVPSGDVRDLTVWAPYTMDYVEAYLRSRQSSVFIGASSGILRIDTALSESNIPFEDTMDHVAVLDGGERQWSILGTFDGHW